MDHTYEFRLQLGGWHILARIDTDQHRARRTWDGASHNHAVYELHVLLSGAVQVDVEGKNHLLQENHAMIVAPGQYHCPVSATGAFDRLAVTFSVEEGPLLQALQAAVSDCRICPVTAEIADACRGVFAECAATADFFRDVLHSHLTRLFAFCFRLLGLLPVACGAEEPRAISRGDHNDVIDTYFETHLKGDARADALAAMLYVSRRQLNRLLQESYGMNFREKLIRTRLNRAAWLLRYTDLPVHTVAEEVGYATPSSIYHVFREHHGMTPEQYRAKNRSK